MNKIEQYKMANMEFVSVQNNNFRVELCNLGASLYQIWFDGKPMTVQVLKAEDFKVPRIRYGKTVGRFSGRIANAKLKIDDKVYQLEENERGNNLHSGMDCFGNKYYSLKDIKNSKDITKVTYEYISPDGEGGFPGKFISDIIYIVNTKENTVSIEFVSVCDKKSVIKLTNHAYFSLGGNDIYSLTLWMNASKQVKLNDENLLAEKVENVPELVDFRKPMLVGLHINDKEINMGARKGYDHYLLFDDNDPNKVQVKLTNDRYELDITTDSPGAQIYTNNSIHNHYPCIGTTASHRRGIAIETQPTHLDPCIYDANTVVKQFIKYKFIKK